MTKFRTFMEYVRWRLGLRKVNEPFAANTPEQSQGIVQRFKKAKEAIHKQSSGHVDNKDKSYDPQVHQDYRRNDRV